MKRWIIKIEALWTTAKYIWLYGFDGAVKKTEENLRAALEEFDGAVKKTEENLRAALEEYERLKAKNHSLKVQYSKLMAKKEQPEGKWNRLQS